MASVNLQAKRFIKRIRSFLQIAAVLLLVCSFSATFASPSDSQAAPKIATCPALLNKTFPRLQDDSPQNLCQYRGKVLLIINTASYCGFTSQYVGLEALYSRFEKQGLVVLGFPSNDFGSQEPGNSKQIADFCFNTYGVKFPMFSKSAVSGPQANTLFQDLRKATGKAPGWNFHKYLVGRDGRVIASFSSETAPDNPALTTALAKALATN